MEDKEEGQKKKSRERKKKKDSHPLMFQNRFWKLSEESIWKEKVWDSRS